MKKAGIIVICCMMCGCASLSKAPVLDFPENTKVVVYNEEMQVRNELDSDQSSEVIQMLEEMKSTNRQSIHDRPVQKIDYYIELSHKREEVVYFYKENGKCYAELPYTGIYECSASLYESLLDFSAVNEVKRKL